MSRYVDALELVKRFKHEKCDYCESKFKYGFKCGDCETMRIVDAIKFETHYIKVIRCKECKHFAINGKLKQCTREYDWYEVAEDDFCSKAEPKGEDV